MALTLSSRKRVRLNGLPELAEDGEVRICDLTPPLDLERTSILRRADSRFARPRHATGAITRSTCLFARGAGWVTGSAFLGGNFTSRKEY